MMKKELVFENKDLKVFLTEAKYGNKKVEFVFGLSEKGEERGIRDENRTIVFTLEELYYLVEDMRKTIEDNEDREFKIYVEYYDWCDKFIVAANVYYYRTELSEEELVSLCDKLMELAIVPREATNVAKRIIEFTDGKYDKDSFFLTTRFPFTYDVPAEVEEFEFKVSGMMREFGIEQYHISKSDWFDNDNGCMYMFVTLSWIEDGKLETMKVVYLDS